MELVEDKHFPTFEDHTLDKTDAKFTDEELASQQYFYQLSLCQHKMWPLMNAACSSARKGR